ncbi:MAG: hypothetical protein WBB28_02170 [Crinalium sp.]
MGKTLQSPATFSSINERRETSGVFARTSGNNSGRATGERIYTHKRVPTLDLGYL